MDKRRSDVLKASPRMFESNLLDKLSRVHPVVPLVIFIPAIAVLFALGQEGAPPLEVTAWIAGGWVFWTLTEYWLHRLVFHFEPEDGIGARLHWIIHGVHHDHPNDPMRLVMPPSVSVPLALGFWALFHWAIGGQSADLFACGFLVGYLAYDMTHYHLHHHTPRTRLGKLFYELHMR
ncbi:MAG TPA: sterol desaturase family protein, partial [Thermoleophilaceae bacterium]|nr:sterol desaturase family protein [Thermoleophilaceae bacterium]